MSYLKVQDWASDGKRWDRASRVRVNRTGGGVSVLKPLLGPPTSPPMPRGVGSGTRPVHLGRHDDSVTCVAYQVCPRWRGNERCLPAEGTIELGREKLKLLIHAVEVSTPWPR